ncbi:MAG TPA: DUF4118 domain-containing protein [Methylotenera sp.]|nr:DUF4118 domain-containing protein [Methylotenera sp.]
MQKQCLQLLGMAVLLAIVTAVNYNFFSSLGITGITLLNLLVVVVAAYFCEFIVASTTALLAFLAINFFFTEPFYTFEVAHIQSWTSLICFLIVSMVIASLVKQLKFQTLQSSIATKHAQFARTLAEKLALATEVNQLLQETCELLQAEFVMPFAVAQLEADDTYSLNIKSGPIAAPDNRLLHWVTTNGKPISPYTDYWTESITKSKQWLLPFNRLPSKDPILVVGNTEKNFNDSSDVADSDNGISNTNSIETYTAIKACVDQISQAYQRLTNTEKVRLAELATQKEAIQSALLASISHDMRTPLTSILGAATALQQADTDTVQAEKLKSLITSQARYLATTTENILSLVRLESSSDTQIPMDWQSPEELIGVVTALYENQGNPVTLHATISESELLIKANATLITQALVNLIDNAKQAQLDESPILIDVTKNNDRIDISVSDRGAGFDECFTVAQVKKFSSGHAKGFGLGLSIVQAIAKSHDACFTIHNRDGGGATATLSFPVPELSIDA